MLNKGLRKLINFQTLANMKFNVDMENNILTWTYDPTTISSRNMKRNHAKSLDGGLYHNGYELQKRNLRKEVQLGDDETSVRIHWIELDKYDAVIVEDYLKKGTIHFEGMVDDPDVEWILVSYIDVPCLIGRNRVTDYIQHFVGFSNIEEALITFRIANIQSCGAMESEWNDRLMNTIEIINHNCGPSRPTFFFLEESCGFGALMFHKGKCGSGILALDYPSITVGNKLYYKIPDEDIAFLMETPHRNVLINSYRGPDIDIENMFNTNPEVK